MDVSNFRWYYMEEDDPPVKPGDRPQWNPVEHRYTWPEIEWVKKWEIRPDEFLIVKIKEEGRRFTQQDIALIKAMIIQNLPLWAHVFVTTIPLELEVVKKADEAESQTKGSPSATD